MDNIAIPTTVMSAPALDRGSVYLEAGKLHPTNSAIYAMTDFRRERPIAVWPSRSIEDALSDMHRPGIQALLVTRPRGTQGHESMLGLITFHRILERRRLEQRLPMEFRECEGVNFAEIMIPWDDLPVISYHSLRYLNVAEVWRMLHDAGMAHAVVVESGDDGSVVARGLISWATVKTRLRESNDISAD